MAKTQNKNKPRKYSRPSIKKMLVVNSEISIEAVETYVKRTLSALYQLDVILYYIGSEEVADAANEKVEKLFDGKLKAFNQDIKKLQDKVEELGDLEEIKYTEQSDREFLIYSPLSARYLKLIKKFEMNTNLIDQLWMNAEMKSSTRKTENNALRSHLRNISNQIVNIARTAMKVAEHEGKKKLVEDEMKALDVDSDVSKEIMSGSVVVDTKIEPETTATSDEAVVA